MIAIDTQSLVWWVEDDRRLRRDVRQRLDDESVVVASTVSIFEIAYACHRGRLKFDRPSRDWIENLNDIATLKIEPISIAQALDAATLPPPMHGDPADRLIVALACQLDVELVTADRKLLDYPHVRTIKAD